MLGLFKRILSKPEAAPSAAPAKAGPYAKPPFPTAPTSPSSAAARLAPSAPAPVQPVAVARPVAPPPTSTHVQVAFAAIAAGLPESISHKVPANPDQFVAVPVDKILPQLAHGQLVISAAELRECAPDYFTALAGHETVPVLLPLSDIVKQLSPEHFKRRSQRRFEVPAEVASVFGNGGKGAAMTRPAARAVPAYRAQPAATTTVSPSAAPAPAPVPVQTAAPKISLSAQSLAALNNQASAPAAVGPRPVTVIRPATPVAVTTPAVTAAPLPRVTTPPAAKASPLAAKKITGEVAVPLAAVISDWVEEVRAQLVDVDVEGSKIMVPLELLEPAMKSGKVLFSWQEVASWIKPPLLIPPTPKVGEMAVELPLKALAPLFMSLHRPGAQKRLAVDQNIPDLFANATGNGSAEVQILSAPAAQVAPAPVTPIAPVAPARIPAAPSVAAARVQPDAPTIPASPALRMATPTPGPVPVTAKLVPPVAVAAAPATPVPPPAPAQAETSLEQIIGEANQRFGVKEIVSRSARLPGAVGALLVMSDGLLVSSQAPPEVKAETIAAFLPQMFGRMNQYTKELTLGPLQQLILGVESGTWHVIKCSNIYFAVLGKRSETLPLNLLAQVAAELSSQSH